MCVRVFVDVLDWRHDFQVLCFIEHVFREFRDVFFPSQVGFIQEQDCVL